MTLSMYNSSVPALKRILSSLAGILGKSAEHVVSKKIDTGVFINARLFPDIFPLSRQIQIATDQAKGCAARLGGVDIPKFEVGETSFDELQMRIAKTIAFLDSFKAPQIDGSEERDIRPTTYPAPQWRRHRGKGFPGCPSPYRWMISLVSDTSGDVSFDRANPAQDR